MKRTPAVLAAAALLAACSEVPDPIGVDPGNVTNVAVAMEIAAPSVVALPAALAPVEDALSRVLEVLPQGPAQGALRYSLAALADAIEADDSCAIRTRRRAAEHALRDLSRRQDNAYEADFEAVKLALSSVEQAGPGRC